MKIGIIGAGPAGVFSAIELLNKGIEDITIIDSGNLIENRKCFANDKKSCVGCGICSITRGWAGAGAFSDSKLNIDPMSLVGGDLGEFYDFKELGDLMNNVLNIYDDFGMKNMNLQQGSVIDEVEKQLIKKEINNAFNIRLHDCETIHLGTDNSRIVYKNMQDYIISKNVKMYMGTTVHSVYKAENGKFIVLYNKKGSQIRLEFDKLILAVGRSGNAWINTLAENIGINRESGKVDIGVRVETTNEIMNKLNKNFYEAKLYMTDRIYGDKCRMFCTNPGGIVSSEYWKTSTQGHLSTVNGHAYADKSRKTDNTNFALLVTKQFNKEMKDPLEDYVFPMIRSANALAGGPNKVLVQSLENLKQHVRSTETRLSLCNLKPTLKATPGDLSSVLPYRILTTILDSIEILDQIVPGINDGRNTLLYGLECKFHSNKIKINKYGETNIEGLYAIGDGSGYTRGIMQAAVQGLLAARNIVD